MFLIVFTVTITSSTQRQKVYLWNSLCQFYTDRSIGLYPRKSINIRIATQNSHFSLTQTLSCFSNITTNGPLLQILIVFRHGIERSTNCLIFGLNYPTYWRDLWVSIQTNYTKKGSNNVSNKINTQSLIGFHFLKALFTQHTQLLPGWLP